MIDCTGNAAVLGPALSVVAVFGTVVLLGDTGHPGDQRLSSDVMTKGLSIIAAHDSHDRNGWDERRVDRLFFERVAQGFFDLSGLITHEFPPRAYREAYALGNDKNASALGILFDWTSSDELL